MPFQDFPLAAFSIAQCLFAALAAEVAHSVLVPTGTFPS